MKKLKLKSLKLDVKEPLSREQMKKVTGAGGSGGGGQGAFCWGDYMCGYGFYCHNGMCSV